MTDLSSRLLLSSEQSVRLQRSVHVYLIYDCAICLLGLFWAALGRAAATEPLLRPSSFLPSVSSVDASFIRLLLSHAYLLLQPSVKCSPSISPPRPPLSLYLSLSLSLFLSLSLSLSLYLSLSFSLSLLLSLSIFLSLSHSLSLSLFLSLSAIRQEVCR
jgi:hypothetical protein